MLTGQTLKMLREQAAVAVPPNPVGHYKKKQKGKVDKGDKDDNDGARPSKRSKKEPQKNQCQTPAPVRLAQSELPAFCGQPPDPNQKSWAIGPKGTKEVARIEVNVTGQNFYLKQGPADLKGFRHISWQKNGGIEKAWQLAQSRMRGMSNSHETS